MKLNIKILNLSSWIVLLSTYILPAQKFEESSAEFGYPLSYLTIYNHHLSRTLFSSFDINIGILVLDIFIIYLIITIIIWIRKNLLKT